MVKLISPPSYRLGRHEKDTQATYEEGRMRRFIPKWVTSHIAVGTTMAKREGRYSNRCPRCDHHMEDTLHVIRCKNGKAAQKWRTELDRILTWMRKQDTNDILINGTHVEILVSSGGINTTTNRRRRGWYGPSCTTPNRLETLLWTSLKERYLQNGVTINRSGIEQLTVINLDKSGGLQDLAVVFGNWTLSYIVKRSMIPWVALMLSNGLHYENWNSDKATQLTWSRFSTCILIFPQKIWWSMIRKLVFKCYCIAHIHIEPFSFQYNTSHIQYMNLITIDGKYLITPPLVSPWFQQICDPEKALRAPPFTVHSLYTALIHYAKWSLRQTWQKHCNI